MFFRLNEREESLFQDVEDGGEEQCKSKKDEQFVGEFTSIVFQDEFPAQVDRGRHRFKLLVCFQYWAWWRG